MYIPYSTLQKALENKNRNKCFLKFHLEGKSFLIKESPSKVRIPLNGLRTADENIIATVKMRNNS